ncbi:hypothetical protein GQR58_029180 [Nymphon striatum]|nr:hypothetical protein GQR58_029180 [Nymphon striatum]
MSVDTPSRSASKEQQATPASFVDLSESELDALIERIEQARTHQLALSVDDYQLLLNALLMLANMQERLSHNDLSIHKLKKLLGMVRSSETLRGLVPAGDADQQSQTNHTEPDQSSRKRSDPKPPRKKRPKAPPIKPTVHRHSLEGMAKGDSCPGCLAGKVYKYTPALLLRVTGHAPLSSERHLCDQLRCNGCGEIFSAELPEHVKTEGRSEQHYGYSARSVMAIYKYFAGSSFYRQETVHNLLGGHVAASTIFDQCEKLADALNPVFKYLKSSLAANARLFYLDDTSNRILAQKPIIKVRHGKERLRSGIYTSAVLAITDEQRRIVLFQTNVGHAGKWMEEILSTRDVARAPPILMSDALSANHVMGHTFSKCLCNAHGRRGFAELSEQSPGEVTFALETYQHA